MLTHPIQEIEAADYAEQIYAIMQAAYTIEAHLLGVDDFFPLRRSARDIADSDNLFLGCFHNSELVGVCELERVDEKIGLIASTVVNPSYFRRGVASTLIAHVLKTANFETVTVSTAEDNLPALKLYQSHGFKVVARATLPDGMRLVTLRFPD